MGKGGGSSGDHLKSMGFGASFGLAGGLLDTSSSGSRRKPLALQDEEEEDKASKTKRAHTKGKAKRKHSQGEGDGLEKEGAIVMKKPAARTADCKQKGNTDMLDESAFTEKKEDTKRKPKHQSTKAKHKLDM